MVDGPRGIDMQGGQSIYPYYYLLGMIPYGIHPDGKSCLVVGVGGGVIPMWYQARGVRTDAVDIDPEIFRLAHDYFVITSYSIHYTKLYDACW